METEMIELEVNGVAVSVPKGSNLLVAAKAANIKIPTLCYHPDLKPGASCGICVVRQLVPSRTEPGKFVPSPKLLRACCTEAMPGMKIITHDPDIVQVRRTVLELILANHPNDCLQCPRSGNCELQAIAADFGIREVPFPREVIHRDVDNSTPSIVLNPDQCINCGRCADVCQNMQNVWALELLGRHRLARRRIQERRRLLLHVGAHVVPGYGKLVLIQVCLVGLVVHSHFLLAYCMSLRQNEKADRRSLAIRLQGTGFGICVYSRLDGNRPADARPVAPPPEAIKHVADHIKN